MNYTEPPNYVCSFIAPNNENMLCVSFDKPLSHEDEMAIAKFLIAALPAESDQNTEHQHSRLSDPDGLLSLANIIEDMHPVLIVGGAECPDFSLGPADTKQIVSALRFNASMNKHGALQAIEETLKECYNRLRYDGDLHDNHGLELRRDASWSAMRMAEQALDLMAELSANASVQSDGSLCGESLSEPNLPTGMVMVPREVMEAARFYVSACAARPDKVFPSAKGDLRDLDAILSASSPTVVGRDDVQKDTPLRKHKS